MLGYVPIYFKFKKNILYEGKDRPAKTKLILARDADTFSRKTCFLPLSRKICFLPLSWKICFLP